MALVYLATPAFPTDVRVTSHKLFFTLLGVTSVVVVPKGGTTEFKVEVGEAYSVYQTDLAELDGLESDASPVNSGVGAAPIVPLPTPGDPSVSFLRVEP